MSDVSHIALAGAAVAAVALIQTTAKKHGTFVSPTSGEIKYVDPDHDEDRHHSPKLTPAEAKEAHMRGLIEDYDLDQDAVKNDVDDSVLPIDSNDIRVKGPERTEQFAAADDAGGPGSGTLDSRSSTAWEDRERVEGGVEGPASGAAPSSVPAPVSDIDQESGDDDAPPVPKRSTRKAAASASE